MAFIVSRILQKALKSGQAARGFTVRAVFGIMQSRDAETCVVGLGDRGHRVGLGDGGCEVPFQTQSLSNSWGLHSMSSGC